MSEEKERIMKLIYFDDQWAGQDDDPGVDYASEYKKQTGKDLETGEYVTQ